MYIMFSCVVIQVVICLKNAFTRKILQSEIQNASIGCSVWNLYTPLTLTTASGTVYHMNTEKFINRMLHIDDIFF